MTSVTCNQPDVDWAYYYEQYYLDHPVSDNDPDLEPGISLPNDENVDPDTEDPTDGSILRKRAPTTRRSDYWELSQVSVPPGQVWKTSQSGSYGDALGMLPGFKYRYDDDPAGAGQTIYAMNEEIIWTDHVVRPLTPPLSLLLLF